MKQIGVLGCLFAVLILGYGQDSLSLNQRQISNASSDSIEHFLKLADSYQEDAETPTSIQRGISAANRAYQLAMNIADTSRILKALNLRFRYAILQRDRKKRSETQKEMAKILRHLGYDVATLAENQAKKEDLYQMILIQETWVLPDSTQSWTLDSIRKPHRLQSFLPNSSRWTERFGEIPVFWLKIRIKTSSKIRETHVFRVGSGNLTWQHIEVFVPDGKGGFEKRITGLKYDNDEKDVNHRYAYFQVPMEPEQDGYIFLRLEGIDPVKMPNGFHIAHVDLKTMKDEQLANHHLNGIFQGVVLIQLFYFLLLFITTKDKTYGFYSLYILGLSICILTVNYIGNTLPSELLNKNVVYALGVWLATTGMVRFSMEYLKSKELMPEWDKIARNFLKVFTLISVLCIIPFIFYESIILEMGIIYGRLLVAIPIIFLSLLIFCGLMLVLVWGIQAYKNGYTAAKAYLIALIFLILGMVLPVVLLISGAFLKNETLLDTDTLVSVMQGGIALQLCFFALGVGQQRNRLEAERREALQANLEFQQKVNTAARRFVPYEFLKTLGHDSILSVNLGDQVEKDVTVFFSDIRDYTTFSERMTPRENFSFLNSYLGRMGPVIKANGGFVNQYYGDGIMALFLGADDPKLAPTDAVEAALDMLGKLHGYNEERDRKGRPFVKIGIGIHSGPLMLGILGDGKRMEAGVVSDSVNTTSRLEGLTKFFGATVLVSEVTYRELKNPDKYHFRDLGNILVKGRKEPIKIYDFFDGDDPSQKQLKLETLSGFQKGLNLYLKRNFEKSIQEFADVLDKNPLDIAAQYYLQKSQDHLIHGVPDDWKGVEIIISK